MLRPYLALIIVPAVLVVWGLFFATQLAASSYWSFVSYQTPYRGEGDPGRADEALSSHVIVVVTEGLRLDQSQQMPNVNTLRARGAARVMRVGLPSLSLPGWTVIGTGAWQEQHGQTTNLNAHPTPMDSIFVETRRKGLNTALVGASGWEVLFKGQLDAVFIKPDPQNALQEPDAARRQDDAIEANALKLLKQNSPNLLLIHFTAVERAYRAFGVFSAEGQRAREDVDARLGRLLQNIDLSQTTLIFTADHGNLDRGGHGGAEEVVLNVPFVAAGRGIRQGQYDLAQQADIAPTLAVLLGTSLPTDNQGDVLFDMLDMLPPAKAQRAVDWAQQIVDRYTTIANVIGVGTVEHPKLNEAKGALAADSYDAAFHAAQAEVNATREAAIAFREGRLQTERLYRTPPFLLFLLPLALYAWLMSKLGWEFRRPLLGALAYFVIFYALFFGRGYSFSLSMLNAEMDVVSWFAARMVDAIGTLALMAVLMGILSRNDDLETTVRNVINSAFFIAAALWFQVCIFYWLYDFSWPWFIPDQSLAFKFYLDLLQTGAFMTTSPPIPTVLLLPFVAVGVRWLRHRLPFGRAVAIRDEGQNHQVSGI